MSIAPTELAESLRAAIQADDRTPYRLAKESGVSAAMLSRFIRGERDLTLTTAGKLCAVLGLKLPPTRKGR